jgi:hypothetical protein
MQYSFSPSSLMRSLCSGIVVVASVMCATGTLMAQQKDVFSTGKFEQLDQMLPSPNTYRTASGAPGHDYWQNRADYVISCELDDATQSVSGSETVTYYNNSPDVLEYLWIQLDQNAFAKTSETYLTRTGSLERTWRFGSPLDVVKSLVKQEEFDGGFKLGAVKDANGKPLKYVINKTMMRIDLPTPLRSKGTVSFSIEWKFNIVPKEFSARSCYEYFPKDNNYLYEVAQWFPRMAVYTDYMGWQHKQFLGQGEFTLPFGNYRVSITTPSDHVVTATGVLQNANAVLTAEQRARYAKAEKTFDKPVLIITPEEAKKNETAPKATTKKTWVYTAQDVRDFAWVSSRKFIWDAMAVEVEGKKSMAMSLYPNEGNPLWEQYSTRSVAHTLKSYSKYSVAYPYPVAISVNGPVGGMEYPMICFNGPRPEPDGTYTERTKYALIGVIIHEVGHNFFPMIINSDERQWTWMDEGLNTFVQYLSEKDWDRNYPTQRGPARNIVGYMSAPVSSLNAIMTNSENISNLGANAYSKPATALNILRETVMGRELFDFAFKTYSKRWAFKHPTPADFFRTMEDASGVDLDWFWRGWFYSNEACDIALGKVTRYIIDTQNPDIEQPKRKQETALMPPDISDMRNKDDIKQSYIEADTAAQDYYNKRDVFAVTPWDKDKYEKYMASLSEEDRTLVKSGKNFYEVEFENIGGLVMPVILETTYEDGTKEITRIPAEIWRLNNSKATKVIMTNKPVKQFLIDPYLETADIDTSNNAAPVGGMTSPTRFQLFRQRSQAPPNPMQIQRDFEQRGGQQGKPIKGVEKGQ